MKEIKLTESGVITPDLTPLAESLAKIIVLLEESNKKLEALAENIDWWADHFNAGG